MDSIRTMKKDTTANDIDEFSFFSECSSLDPINNQMMKCIENHGQKIVKRQNEMSGDRRAVLKFPLTGTGFPLPSDFPSPCHAIVSGSQFHTDTQGYVTFFLFLFQKFLSSRNISSRKAFVTLLTSYSQLGMATVYIQHTLPRFSTTLRRFSISQI